MFTPEPIAEAVGIGYIDCPSAGSHALPRFCLTETIWTRGMGVGDTDTCRKTGVLVLRRVKMYGGGGRDINVLSYVCISGFALSISYLFLLLHLAQYSPSLFVIQ